jgi:hypothetical protein
MLEYCKIILQKVSFSPALFAKELKKALKWLKNDDKSAFQAWCTMTYGDLYPDIIQESFKRVRS